MPNAIFTPICTAFLKFLALDLVPLGLLRGEVLRDPGRLALADVLGVVDVGDEVGAALLHEAQPLVVDVGSVLDRGDAGLHRELDPLGRVRVRGDLEALVRGLLDRGADLVVGVLDRVGIRAVRQEGARREHLDDVHAVLRDVAHALADLVHAVGDAEFEVPRQADVRGEAPDIAPPPPVIVRYAPATNMRGPGKYPFAIASRIATSTKARYVPTSRTVVKPASSVAFAFGIDS